MNKENKPKKIPDKEMALAASVYQKFRDAIVAKSKYTEEWLRYLNAWNNSLYEDKKVPSYKTNHVSNFIYSSIESMRPVLFDQNPKFEAIPVTAEGMQYSQDITTILDWEWHKTNMQLICLSNSIYTFALGTSIIMLNYERSDNPNSEVDGDVKPIPVSPFNLYPDPLATSVEDAEYIIYANYMHVNILKAKYPSKAEFLIGSDIKYSELVNDRDENAIVDNQVLVLEMWCRDYTTIDVEEHREDGTVDKYKKRKYPKGRVIIAAPELGLILEDKENPYNTGRFPFFLFKDIEVPFQFWGEGEVKWLLSPQKQCNDLYNQIIDNAKHTANMQWVIDKNAGIPKGELTNRPGLIIRKNPGSEVRRDSPPAMPMYVQQMIDTLKNDIEVVSGIHDVTRGQTPSGIQSASAIIALQEAAQTRIRLKVTLHENALGQLGTEWVERIKQFWKFNRVVPKRIDESNKLPNMELIGSELRPSPSPEVLGDNISPSDTFKMININPDNQLKHDYVIKIVGSSSMQQSKASLLDQMIRLAQTPAEDGMPMVPREAVLDYLPNVNKNLIMGYFQKLKEEQLAKEQQQGINNQGMQAIAQLGEQIQQIGQAVSQMQQRFQQQDQEEYDNNKIAEGYERGMTEASLMNRQLEKNADIPPELLSEISRLDDEQLSQLIQQNPEIAQQLMME